MKALALLVLLTLPGATARAEETETTEADPRVAASRTFHEDYVRGLGGRRLRPEDAEDLRALAEAGHLQGARLSAGEPPVIEFETTVDGQGVLVRFSPGLESGAAAPARFALGRRGQNSPFTPDPSLDLSAMPFFQALPSTQEVSDAPGPGGPRGGIGAGLLTHAASLAALLTTGVTPPGGVPGAVPPVTPTLPAPPTAPGDRFEVRRRADGFTYLYRNGAELGYRFEAPGGGHLYYAEGAGRVYDAAGVDLGGYAAVDRRMRGAGPVTGDLFAGPAELRYRLRDGRLYAPDGTTVVGFIPNDPRYGSERVLFIHADNTAGTNSGSPWMVYSMDGRPLGRYEDVYARTVRDHDGNAQSRVLVPGGTARGADGRTNPVYRTLDGKVFEGLGGTIQPFFTRQEQAQLDQLARLRDIERMSPGVARDLALRLARSQMDTAFAARFPIAGRADLTTGLPDNLLLALGEGGAAGLPARLAALERVRAPYATQLAEARRLYEEEAESTRETRQALELRIAGARHALEDYRARTRGVISSAIIETERRLYDAQSRLEGQLYELERPLLTRADERNRLNAIVSDLSDLSAGLAAGSGVPQALEAARRSRESFAALAGEGERREFRAGMGGSERAVFDMTQAFAALRTNRAEAERVAADYRAARAEVDRLPDGPARDAARGRVEDLSRRRDSLIYGWRGLSESLDRIPGRARSLHDGFTRLAGLSGAERTRQEASLREELRLPAGADLAVHAAQYTGEGWRSHEAALRYLSGVRASQSWRDAIAERRAMFDVGVRMIMDSTDPVEQRGLLRQ
ncbi:MAG: hypothetical protein HYZ75_18470 [Elusimicrobia bacterium]|nr:hypothetical protein [Elusimicrobiota bacterium]